MNCHQADMLKSSWSLLDVWQVAVDSVPMSNHPRPVPSDHLPCFPQPRQDDASYMDCKACVLRPLKNSSQTKQHRC